MCTEQPWRNCRGRQSALGPISPPFGRIHPDSQSFHADRSDYDTGRMTLAALIPRVPSHIARELPATNVGGLRAGQATEVLVNEWVSWGRRSGDSKLPMPSQELAGVEADCLIPALRSLVVGGTP